jgi:hypothetical protein
LDGEKGEKGDTSNDGLQGQKGDKGEKGEQGPPGKTEDLSEYLLRTNIFNENGDIQISRKNYRRCYRQFGDWKKFSD